MKQRASNHALMLVHDHTYHCYNISPIDWWWGAVTYEQYVAQIQEHPGGCDRHVDVINLLLLAAKVVCDEKLGWEGDMREGPYIAGLPSEDALLPVIMFKQDNNGTTFVVSPKPLPWLEQEF